MTEEQRVERNRRKSERRRALSPGQLDKVRRRDRARQKARREADPARFRVYASRARAKLTPEDRDRRREYGKEWRIKNADGIREKQALWSEENKDRKRATHREWYAANKDRVREQRLAKKGFTLASKEAASAGQQHKCAICAVDFRRLPAEHIHADHCHATGCPRGVLCHHCNTALGLFKDSIDTLRAAISYLKKPPLGSHEPSD